MSTLYDNIKKLRDKTGAGINHCKQALIEAENNMEAAVDWLRVKGISIAKNKLSRSANEKIVSFIKDNDKVVMLEFSCETDFVAKNTDFHNFIELVLEKSLSVNSIEDLKKSEIEGRTVDEKLQQLIAVIKENIIIRRMDIVTEAKGNIFTYVHNSYKKTDRVAIGKIGVVVSLDSDADYNSLHHSIGDGLAKHISFADPSYINRKDVPQDIINKEESIIKESLTSSNKPEQVINMMVQGKLEKFFEGIVLEDQRYVLDDKLKIKDIISDFKKKHNCNLAIKEFIKF